MNVINSSLQDWFYEFSEFRLLETSAVERMKVLNTTLNVFEFFQLQELYRINTISLLKHVWHRGAILIIKKFKLLKRPGLKKAGQWTFLGYQNKSFQDSKQYHDEEKEHLRCQMEQDSMYEDNASQQFLQSSNQTYRQQQNRLSNLQENQNENSYDTYSENEIETPRSLQYLEEVLEFQNEEEERKLNANEIFIEMVKYYMEFDNLNEEFDHCVDLSYDQLPDIREAPAYKTLAQIAGENEKIWKEENGWKLYTKEYRQKILENVSFQMSLQLRHTVEQSVNMLYELIMKVPTLSQWLEQNQSEDSFVQEQSSEANLDIKLQSSQVKISQISSQKQSRKPSTQMLLSSKEQFNPMYNTSSNLNQNPNLSQLHKKSILGIDQSKLSIRQSFNQQNQNLGLSVFQSGQQSQQIKGLQQLCPPKQELQFKMPIQLQFNQNFESILNINMVIKDQGLTFLETKEKIISSFRSYYRQMICSVNFFLHPKLCKLKIDPNYNPQEQMEKRMNDTERNRYAWEGNLDIDNGAIDDIEDFYRAYIPYITLNEKVVRSNAQDELAGILQGIGIDSRQRYLPVINLKQEEKYQNIENELIQHLEEHFNECQTVFSVFDQFRVFYNKQAEKEINKVISKGNQLTNEEVKIYHEILNKFLALVDKVPNNVYLPLFDIKCSGVKNELKEIILGLRKDLEKKFQDNLYEAMKSLTDKYTEISAEIRKSTTTAEEVENMEKYINDLLGERIVIKQKTLACFKKLDFLLKLEVDLKKCKRIFDLTKDLHEWPVKLDEELKIQEEKHILERENLENQLKEKRYNFEQNVDLEFKNLREFESLIEYKLYKDYVKKINDFQTQLEQLQATMEEIINEETQLFGFPSNFEKFAVLQKNFDPYNKLWKSVDNFVENKKKWVQGPITNLDPTEIEIFVKQFVKTANKLYQTFNGTMIERVAEKFREEVFELNRNLSAIEIVTRPGLKERHWAEIASVLDIEKIVPEEISLLKLNKAGLDQKINEVEEIAENSQKEFSLESALDKMEKEWENLKFIVVDYKNRGIKILQGAAVEEIQILIDDHSIKSQTIKQNPNIKFMERRANEWEAKMSYGQQVLEAWIKVQTLYLYLEPIFSFEDISKTLKMEAEKFEQVDTIWKDIMEKVDEDPHVLHCITGIPRLLQLLNQCNTAIEDIQKGLEEHLESKRLEFPRFFFLSNDDLINILAETKDPLLVQPHMKKCFEGISELIFNSNTDIVGMRSSEKEEVVFTSRIAPRNFKSHVEKWLQKVEDQMIESLKKITEDSLIDLKSNLKKRDTWVKRWPGMVILCINQLNWTESVEEKLLSKKENALLGYYHELEQYKEQIVSMVRGKLSTLEMMTLGALIVIAVHNNDVVKEMVDDNINSTNDFEWQAQMRYVWNQDQNQIDVKMMSTSLPFGYEYLGNTTRLVITPLTDRCYRTLMSALHLNLGGAPEGPAGTGKTETTKDLAKALAIQCIVFNCSEGLNIHSMAKFFKGLISAGAWSCFDEFNRIDVEVLSVIAQQILEIQQAKAGLKKQMVFYGTQLNIQYSCNVFITMNPGYAGRSELPDNLKALFRPVAMMVPDYARIAEISLYSFGFLDARNLAKKIVIVYKLCSEQLSSQDHYDYGMRAVKTVLVAAQQLKRQYPSEKEDILVLRSICDVNQPKFLTQDLSLFKGITSDLFPGTKLPPPDYEILNNCMTDVLEQKNLQSVQNFRHKVLQLYEVVNTRHGLMLVGQPFSGKSTCYKVLASTLGEAKKRGANEQNTFYHVINPKSISINQLYGQSDPVSKEWTEGILSEIYRKCATNQSSDRQFIVFDGPVDAEWIENMNTVLDDNKKLCLSNGETIAMTNYMTMMFEVADLKQASPATVSRCGMVYMQPDQLGWHPLFKSWLKKIENLMEDNLIVHIEELFDALIEPCMHYIKYRCKQYQEIPEGAMVVGLIRLFHSLLKSFNMLNKVEFGEVRVEEQIARLQMVFQYSLIWTVAATIDNVGRKNFDKYYKKIIKEPLSCSNLKNKLVKIEKMAAVPDIGNITIYDYYIDKEEFTWKKWSRYLEENPQNIQNEQNFHNIVIETVEMVRITSLIQQSVSENIPLMLIGPTGTGKSTYINKYIKNLPLEKFSLIFVNFSAQTSSEKTQEIIDARLDRRRKGQYGPRLGMKCLIFIDDTNMPQYDKYGAQPPIELLRQFMDQGGWYKKDRNLIQIIDTQLICAMGPPGGGRNEVTPRFLRHFNTLCTVESSQQELNLIFSSLMKWHIQKQDINLDLHDRYQQCVEASIEMYDQICKNLRPTPAKSVYLFNQRDLSRVIQGMMLLEKNQINVADGYQKVARLWIHELNRVFYDRLKFEEDQNWYYNTLNSVLRSKLKDDMKNILKQKYDHYKLNLLNNEPLKVIRFGEVMAEVLDDYKPYDEILDMPSLYDRLNYFVEDYNQNTKRPMNLVLFEFAVDHILKLTRILRTQQGHGLLIGLGGSGRQSMTLIAAHIRDISIFQVEMTKSYTKENWVEDMQKVLISAGADNKECVFIISDSQIQQPFILEDINNLLNSGDIPSLFAQEDFVPLIDRIRTHAKKEGRTQLIDSGSNEKYYDYFIECVKRKLHVIMVMSPIGDALRTRIRMFPNIVNCSSIIQYTQWPEEGLEAVAHKMLHEMDSVDHTVQRKLVHICKDLHKSALNLSEKYLQEQGRHNYITPSSYLELIYNMKIQIVKQKQRLEERQKIYENGVQKILLTSSQVKAMEEDLQAKRPVLIQTNEETQQIAQEIKKQLVAIEPKKKEAEVQKAMVDEKVEEAQKINDECEKELSVAKPQLEKAEKALDTLDANDIFNLRTMQKPPGTVRLVMEAVCVFLEIPPTKVGRAGMVSKDQMYDYWESSKKLLAEKDFLLSLQKYDKNNIKSDIMKKIREKYIPKTDFNPARVAKASSAAKGLCEWILAMSEYEKVLKIVRPKQEKYNQSRAQVAELQKELKKTESELNAVLSEIKKLEDQHDILKAKQIELQADIDLCEKKLKRAESIIGGLGGEQERWKNTSQILKEQLNYIVGDVVISTAIISYLGNFTSVYRAQQIKKWTQDVQEQNINVSENFSLASTLGEPIQIRKWQMNGLPSDQFSTENGIITYTTKRWPLFIDPQGQATRWIKKNESDSKVIVTKQTESGFVRHLENSISFGQVLIIENVKEEIDSILDPILSKQTFKNSGILSIKVGDNIIDYSRHFKLYLASKLNNPHFTPEISTKMTLINFGITKEGLDDQLLELCVFKEEPEHAETRNNLIVQGHKNQKQLEDLEQQILDVLNKADNILEDEEGVKILSQSKEISLDIQDKQQTAKEINEKIDELRHNLKPIALHSSILFFTLMDMAKQDYMYQYSLNWFLNMYQDAFDKAQQSDDVNQRVNYVIEYFTYQFYQNVCRSLFEKDKLLFSFLLQIKLLQSKNALDMQEFNFFIQPINTTFENPPENQCSTWMPEQIWLKFVNLDKNIKSLRGVLKSLQQFEATWKKIYEDPNAHEMQFPEPYSVCSNMQRLCLLKCLRPDRIVRAGINFIKSELGLKFTQPPPFNLSLSYSDSSWFYPLVFVLPGTDPMSILQSFSQQKQKELESISLGQGQGQFAEQAIKKARENGNWVVLQNCHLAPSWMPKLEKICEEMYELSQSQDKDQQHPGFRLFLTSYPTNTFPVSILQNSVKMTNEPPKGLKFNLTVSYMSDPINNQEFFEKHSKPDQFKTLLYGLCLFHAVIQERTNFGPLGWNIKYDFNQSDLRISARQLNLFLGSYEFIPYKALHYMIGECNYGGRVTDDRDRRILKALMNDFFGDGIFEEGFCFSDNPKYNVPPIGSHKEYLDFIQKIPQITPSSLFGFHENAEIVKDLKETDEICGSLLLLSGDQQSAKKQSDHNEEEQLKQLCQNIIEKMPKKFEREICETKYPIEYKNSMNTVLQQEIIRYNKLTYTIKTSLIDFQKALDGTIVMSEQLEQMGISLSKGLVPEMWKKRSYPSLKPLASYIKDLINRLNYFHQWIDDKPHTVHWISGYFFTQAFLTAISQNYARKYQIPIDTLSFEFQFFEEPQENIQEQGAQIGGIEDGCLTYGLYLEGCGWDFKNKKLKESDPKVLHTKAPIIYIKPVEGNVKLADKYSCPVYKTAERKGTLSTTGHSTNFIMNIEMNTDVNSQHWVKRGVALLCQLSD
ncbi:P-loop containing nucleoside triphosphate hydrolase [Pseudocohnilembus persalinus]|uniref:p-loop containing nucleoside triphosphate hydrolase n=1 Tax=Pseudocohnilembus persalinus TaxID=266149 RepID=A0A0V0QTR1_PSEPJ|nr:P-loop containing nucleoside triphosphate hydrolase [Pseudocohnilembus persalinus]|eukprot:KRX05785.1 P-loop containing nucleoside triphosphate hydrolase [Pseudocohnilembus persalinus]